MVHDELSMGIDARMLVAVGVGCKVARPWLAVVCVGKIVFFCLYSESSSVSVPLVRVPFYMAQ